MNQLGLSGDSKDSTNIVTELCQGHKLTQNRIGMKYKIFYSKISYTHIYSYIHTLALTDIFKS